MFFSKKMLIIIPLCLCIMASGCLSCCQSTPTPPQVPGSSTSTYSNYYKNDPGASTGEIQKSSATIKAASAAIGMGDKDGFEASLSKEAKERYGTGFDVSGDGAKSWRR